MEAKFNSFFVENSFYWNALLGSYKCKKTIEFKVKFAEFSNSIRQLARQHFCVWFFNKSILTKFSQWN